jgi:glycosyltransferase involved in cell wall biosynthesis/SAM-dependent methyltransferase
MYRGRILAVADAPFCATGYGNQSNAVLSRLAQRGWEVFQIGCNVWFTGQEKVESDGHMRWNGIKVIRNFETKAKGVDGLYGSKEFQRQMFDELKPDVVWSLNDFYRVGGMTEIGEDFIDRWVHWLPVDNPYSTDSWGAYMNRLKFFVFLSSFGWRQQVHLVKDVMYKDAIYHAVPSDVFKPLPGKEALKERHGIGGRFVITTVGRHQPRKMIFQTAYAVGEFLKRHDDAFWICKCDPSDPAMRDEPKNEADLEGLMREYGVRDRVSFEAQMLPEDQMNELYNTGDVFMHISGGEGFGIPYVESMLAGVPCILTDNTTSPELTDGWDFGLPVKVAGQRFLSKYGVKYDYPDVQDAGRQLEFAYEDWRRGGQWLTEAGKRAREFHLKWCAAERVVDRWEEILWRIMRYNNKVLWHSFFGRGVGFTAISEAIIPALEGLGYDVYVNDWQSGESPILEPRFKDLYEKYLKARETIDFTAHPQVICWLMEAFPSVKGDWKIGWSLCESTKLRSYYMKNCNMMDYLVTSSEFNKKVQEESGVVCPIRIVPPCVDPGRFPVLERSSTEIALPIPSGPLVESPKPLTFLHIGVVQERKNPLQMVDGYCQAFPPNGRTRLLYKSNDFGVLDWFREHYKDRPDIEWIYTSQKPLHQAELLRLYQKADVYVNLSHGEGIGMPDLEAMATGLPVVGLNWDTRGLFLSEKTGWPLAVNRMEKAYRSTVQEDCGDWGCADTEEYVNALKEIANDPAVAREKGKRAAELVRREFTPEKAAAALDAVLFEIYEKRFGRREAAYGEEYYSKVHKYDEGYFENAAGTILHVTKMEGNVLDVGCGRGYLMKHLLAHGVSVTGIDISDYAVSNPLSECAGRIFRGDALDIPYPDGAFDWGISFSVLEHIPEKDLMRALKELKRVCKRLFLEISLPLHPGHEKQIAAEDPTHCTLHPFSWWEGRLKEAGLRVVAYDGGMSMVVEPIVIETKVVKPGDRVLVGIPTKDRPESLRMLLESLVGQTFKDFDVAIVDDSRFADLPNDGKLNEVLADLYRGGHSWFAFRGPAQNQAVAHNNIMKFAVERGYKLVFRVDDDIVLKADHLELLFKEFVKDGGCRYAAMGGIFLNPHMDAMQQRAPPNWREIADFRGDIHHCVLWAQTVLYPEEIPYRDDVQHLYSSYMYRPELVASVGGFPSDLSSMGYREETVPIYALWLQGYDLRIVTGAYAWHYNAGEGGLRSVSPEAAKSMYQADELLFLKRIAQLEAAVDYHTKGRRKR